MTCGLGRKRLFQQEYKSGDGLCPMSNGAQRATNPDFVESCIAVCATKRRGDNSPRRYIANNMAMDSLVAIIASRRAFGKC